MSKTVYVLGAGFSREGKAPSQDNILNEIINLKEENVISAHPNLHDNWGKFVYSRNILIDFLQGLFQPRINSITNIELEDVFTLLDKAISEHQFIREFSEKDLIERRQMLNFCLVYMFDSKLYRVESNFYINLAREIVSKRLKVKINNDIFSFINLNWDLLLDNAIYSETEFQRINYNKKISIDYCFYTDSFEYDAKYVPHIRLKAKGIKNIKVLKPHGSFNWLVCMNCGKVLIDFEQRLLTNKIALFEFIEKTYCRICNSWALKAVIKTPTLLKDFHNVHLSDILHNIQIELIEASRIVFVGYSFPFADIELRYIFKRCINKDAIIEVVLIDDDKYDDVIKRYEMFFGKQIITTQFENLGSVKFFQNEFDFN